MSWLNNESFLKNLVEKVQFSYIDPRNFILFDYNATEKQAKYVNFKLTRTEQIGRVSLTGLCKTH